MEPPGRGEVEPAAIAAEALRTRRPIAELVLERRLLDRAELDRLLAPANLVGPLRAPFSPPNPDALTRRVEQRGRT